MRFLIEDVKLIQEMMPKHHSLMRKMSSFICDICPQGFDDADTRYSYWQTIKSMVIGILIQLAV